MKSEICTLTVGAEVEKLPEVIAFIDGLLGKNNCSMKAHMQIDIAVEEIFVNIARYAYPKGDGTAEIRANVTHDCAEITLIDSGIPYDPTKKPDPDVTLSAEERQIGGLGIFMTKKLMDAVCYEYSGGKNVLTIKKRISA